VTSRLDQRRPAAVYVTLLSIRVYANRVTDNASLPAAARRGGSPGNGRASLVVRHRALRERRHLVRDRHPDCSGPPPCFALSPRCNFRIGRACVAALYGRGGCSTLPFCTVFAPGSAAVGVDTGHVMWAYWVDQVGRRVGRGARRTVQARGHAAQQRVGPDEEE
jgi:hypothetical protein